MEQYRFPEQEQRFWDEQRVPLAVYQFVDKRVVTLAVSAGFVKLLGLDSREEAVRLMDNDMYRDAHPDDVARISNAALRFATEGVDYDVIYRVKLNGAYTILHAKGEHFHTQTGERLAVVWYTNEGEYSDGETGSALNRAINNALREDELYRRVNFDYLTGLPSMTYFFELAEERRKDAQAQSQAMAMLFLDLNGMRYYNEKYGFSEGNNLIQDFAKLLVSQFGSQCCCRLAQDHFAAFAPAEGLEDRLNAIFKQAEGLNGGRSLPVRVGIYLNTMKDVGAIVACDRAKAACDINRNTFVSRYAYYSEDMQASAQRKQYILNTLDRAIREQWIKVYYQPIIRAANGCVCDEEALARWIDPDKDMLSPAEFIPVLEESRLIYKLDLYVVDRIIEKLRVQAEAGLYIVPVSVNLSRADFDACDVVEEIRRRVDAAGIGRDKLTIEITESIIGSDFDFMKAQIERFQKLGFQVWMDDFGSGYSTLDVLQSIHFDLIKLDMRFLQQFDEGDKSRIILTELVRMAMGLDTETVCEGVETEAQAEFLREIGCTKLQGFFYCRPIPMEQVLERYRTGTQIGFENPAESEYYAALGRVNLYDMALIAGEDNDAFRRYFDTLPTAILEVREFKCQYLRCNRTYRDFMKRMFGMILIGVEMDYATMQDGPGSAFMKSVLQCSRDGNRAIIDEKMSDGSTVHSFVRRIAVNPVTQTAAIAVAVLAITEQSEHFGTTFAHIAQSLSADYVNLYYVDLETENFIEYSSDATRGALALECHGEDFFSTSRRDAARRLYVDDRDFFIRTFTKENVVRAMDEHGTFMLTYRLMIDDVPTYVNMKATRMQDDDHSIIIGVSNVDAQMKQREAMERVKAERVTYARITALSGDCICLYTVDPETGRYSEYSATSAYEGLGIDKAGNDFFSNTIKDSARHIYEEDIEMFRSMFTRENVMREIERNGIFSLRYRLMMDGAPVYVRIKAVMVQEHDGAQLIIGVINIDAQVKREQEYAQKLSAARSRANLDGLTGVKNKVAYQSVSDALNQQIEEGQPVKYAIVLCNVTDLEAVNRTQGRQAGDRRIMEACAVICETFKHSPVFRVGGDEFAVIAQGHDYECIDALMETLDERNAHSREDGDIVIASGMAKYDGNGNVATVFKRADILRQASADMLGHA